jgi:hypothetical protein
MEASRGWATSISGASIRIIAGHRSIRTSRGWEAIITGTIIAIIAVNSNVVAVSSLSIARISGTEIVIVTLDSIIGTLSLVAVVIRTRIVIIAINRSVYANTSLASIDSARVIIIAVYRRIYAGIGIRAASISSAEIVIVTIHSSHRTSLNGIARRCVARKSSTLSRGVNASSCGIARVISASIVIIAINRSVRNYTSRGIAGVSSASVIVIDINFLGPASSLFALISSTKIIIITNNWGTETTRINITGINHAGIT